MSAYVDGQYVDNKWGTSVEGDYGAIGDDTIDSLESSAVCYIRSSKCKQ